MAPDVIGHYRIISTLGVGGMGEVYLAEDTRLRRKAALKLLSSHFTADEDRVRRFELEAQAVSALNHPNILTIYDVGDQDGLHFIATEFIEGETLRQHTRRARLTIRKTLDIAIQVAGALAAAHEAGIIHRDIKPENIMLRPDGWVKVLDFGLAKLAERHTFTSDTQAPTIAATTDPGTVMGTINYMSPEQARGLPVDVRSDVFSLGVVIYEMIAGRSPFEAETPSDVMSFILHKSPPPLFRFSHETPAEMERIVAKALSKDKDERYQTVKDLLIDLKRLNQRLDLEAELEHSLITPLAASPGSGPSSPFSSSASAAHGNQQTSPTPSAQSVVSKVKRHKKGLALLLSAFLVGAVAATAYFTSGGETIDSLAILPFLNASGDPNTEYLSDGIAESIIYNLSQLTDLRVIPRSSVVRYKGREADPQSVARELGVRAVLSGKVVQLGNELVVSAELVDAEENRLLWGRQFNSKPSDALSLQQEISGQVAGRLRPNLAEEKRDRAIKRRTENTEAYQNYLKGQFWLNKRSEEGFQKAAAFFNQAVESDPGYALPYAGLADCYALLCTYSLMAPTDGFPKAKAAAMKALERDDRLAEAHTSLANILSCYDWDFANAEREFKASIELNPNYATAHHWYAEYLSAVGRHDEAVAEIRRAQQLDPLSLIISSVAGRTLYYAKRYDEAVEQLNKTINMDQSFGPAYVFLCAAYQQKGMHDKAIRAAQEAVNISPNTPVYMTILGHAYAAYGKRDEAEKIIGQLNELSKHRYIQPSYVALLCTGLGDKERAFQWFEKALRERDDRLIFVVTDPLVDSLRTDPRFGELIRRIGLPE